MGEQLQLFDDSEYIVEVVKDEKCDKEPEEDRQDDEIRVLPGQLQMFRKLGLK